MLRTIPDILARIVDQKRAELPALEHTRDILEQRAAKRPASRGFRRALEAHDTAIIAEIKKASPSRGLLAESFDPARIAAAYESAGAAAISVLTDELNFQGSLSDLRAARAAVCAPVLRKDFTVSPLHIIEAAANGADAILLIAAVLGDREMRDFRELAASNGMDALVEVHDEEDLARAADSGAEIIGVNNRDLRTFEVTLDTSLRLADRMPPHAVRVAESGISSRDDIQRLKQAGFGAFLVGEHLMKAADPAAALRELIA
ncbi:MAG TPA: indole-3-glycerol phosphate synthase TrpC [Bryobacteraceae bacterium]|nr:indole-3-glycerol phosphate synthase TrpC [Bryobacteraceae bacterium]